MESCLSASKSMANMVARWERKGKVEFMMAQVFEWLDSPLESPQSHSFRSAATGTAIGMDGPRDGCGLTRLAIEAPPTGTDTLCAAIHLASFPRIGCLMASTPLMDIAARTMPCPALMATDSAAALALLVRAKSAIQAPQTDTSTPRFMSTEVASSHLADTMVMVASVEHGTAAHRSSPAV